jgi:Ca2+-binding EF-hand superfamily protein
VKTHWMFACIVGAILLAGTIVGVRTASAQKSSGSMSGAKQWLAAMDTDHDGTVSKQEFTAYMEAQFDKADADHEGTLDEKELEQLRKNLELAKKP